MIFVLVQQELSSRILPWPGLKAVTNYLVVIEVFLFAQRGVRVRVGLNYAKLT